jgi:hypothetical protein
VERKMPPEFIAPDGFHITDACRAYLQPLIEERSRRHIATACLTMYA